MTIGKKIGVGFGSMLLLVFILASVVLYRTNSINKQFTFVIEHDAPVIANAHHLSKLILDMETGQRGYVITGNEEFLEPYIDAILSFDEMIEVEKALVSDNPPQVKMLEHIEEAVREWQERAAKPEINLRRAIAQRGIGSKSLEDMLIGEVGKKTLDQFREIADELEKDFAHEGNIRGVFLLNSLAKYMVDQETDQRGFLITGHENFLDPFVEGRKKLAHTLIDLRELIDNAHDREATAQDILELERLHEQWITKAATPEIAMRRTILTALDDSPDSAQAQAQIEDTLIGGVGKQILDDIRQIIDRMDERFTLSENEQMRLYSIAMAKAIVDQETGQRGFLLTGREEFLEPYYIGQEHWRQSKSQLTALNSKAYNIAEMTSGIDQLEALADDWLEFAAEPEIAARREIDSHPESLEDVAAHIEAGEGKRILDRIRGYFALFIEEEQFLTSNRYDLASRSFSQTNTLTIAIALSSLIFGVGMAFKITKGITRPIRILTDGLSAVAQGNTSGEIKRTSNDEIGEVTDSFNLMVTDLAQLESIRRESSNELAIAKNLAEDANRAKSQFLANMSHEIRTPMTAIIGFTDIIRDNVTSPENIEAITTVRRNGEFLLSIINDILDLSKIEAGKTEMEQISVSPCQLVAEVMSLMRVRAEGKGLACNAEYIGAIPKMIISDPTRLRQILINLLGNAIKFTDEGGVRLIVRFNAQSDSDEKTAAPTLQFDVLDTGVGMTQEQKSQLFRPFTQADNSTTRKYGGTGLGLTISKRFAELLGGDLSVVDSEVDGGTRFRAIVNTGPINADDLIEDPISEVYVSKHANESVPHLPDALDGIHILVAEDGPDNQRLIKYLLTKSGATVHVVSNGSLALKTAMAAHADGDPFDVILMDMQMPVMDGYTASSQLRQRGYPHPIVALTAHAMEGDREKCLSSGCNDFATKPIDRSKLIETILNQSRQINRAA